MPIFTNSVGGLGDAGSAGGIGNLGFGNPIAPLGGSKAPATPSVPVDPRWPAKFTFEQFVKFTESLEGGAFIDFMFMVQDKQVATGLGITFVHHGGLDEAKRLPWHLKGSTTPRTPDEIEADFNTVLSHPEIAFPGNLDKWSKLTSSRLARHVLLSHCKSKIVDNLNTVRRRGFVGDYDSFPADAQLCVASITWAVGPNFDKVRGERAMVDAFCAACKARDFRLAEENCTYSDTRNTLPRRSAEQRTMMHNADLIERGQGDPSTLFFPARLHRAHIPIL
jgi:hypothetical protein